MLSLGGARRTVFVCVDIVFPDLIVGDIGMLILWQTNNVHNYDCWDFVGNDYYNLHFVSPRYLYLGLNSRVPQDVT